MEILVKVAGVVVDKLNMSAHPGKHIVEDYARNCGLVKKALNGKPLTHFTHTFSETETSVNVNPPKAVVVPEVKK